MWRRLMLDRSLAAFAACERWRFLAPGKAVFLTSAF